MDTMFYIYYDVWLIYKKNTPRSELAWYILIVFYKKTKKNNYSSGYLCYIYYIL